MEVPTEVPINQKKYYVCFMDGQYRIVMTGSQMSGIAAEDPKNIAWSMAAFHMPCDAEEYVKFKNGEL